MIQKFEVSPKVFDSIFMNYDPKDIFNILLPVEGCFNTKQSQDNLVNYFKTTTYYNVADVLYTFTARDIQIQNVLKERLKQAIDLRDFADVSKTSLFNILK